MDRGGDDDDDDGGHRRTDFANTATVLFVAIEIIITATLTED